MWWTPGPRPCCPTSTAATTPGSDALRGCAPICACGRTRRPDPAVWPARAGHASGRVSRDGNPVTLTAMEYRILAYMMHQRHRTISQSDIVEHVYAQDYDRDSNTIEVLVGRLRKKLGKDSIVTVRGPGYGPGEPV